VHTVAVLKTLRDGFRDTIASINSLADDGEITLEGMTTWLGKLETKKLMK